MFNSIFNFTPLILIIIIIVVIVFIIFNRNIKANKYNKKYLSTHRVKLLTKTDGLSLRKKPDSNMSVFMKLENGIEVQLISIGNTLILGENKGFWYEIRTKDNIIGWCFSGSLEKI